MRTHVPVHGLLITASLLAAFAGAAESATSEHGKASKKSAAYGAIAWDRETSSSGYSYNHKSEREAKVEALNQCGRDRCEIMTSFRNECGALAIGKKNTVAMTGATRAEAETKALRKCGPECRPVAWACTR